MPRVHRSPPLVPVKKLEGDTVAVTVPEQSQTRKKAESFQQPQARPTASLGVPRTPNAGTGASVGAMADLLARATGGTDGAALMSKTPGLGASLRLFAAELETTPPEDRPALALKALRHHVVNSPGALPNAVMRALGKDHAAIANDYARDLGFEGVRFDGSSWQLLAAGQEPVKLKARDGLLESLGKAINEQRFSTASVLPPYKPVEIGAQAFDVGNAHLAVHLSTLAYQPKEVVLAQLQKWGFDTSTFRWVENKQTDTQGFVVADKKGNVFPVFRGTSSARDWGTNAQTGLGTPGWQPKPDFKAHQGFAGSLESVWPQVREALAQAARAAGPNAKVMFTGHSLGAALTQLAAVRAASEGLVTGAQSSVYTLGSPRVGDDAFKAKLERLFPNAFRLVNYQDGFFDKQDVVTQIPPKAMGFRHAGSVARLGSAAMELIDKLSNNAALRDFLEHAPVEDPFDIANPEIEQMNEAELREFMQRAMGEATDVAPDSSLAKGQSDAGAMAEMVPLPSVSAHSTGVYLDRVGVQTQAEPNLFG